MMENMKKNFMYNACYQLLIIAIPLITTPYLSRVLGAENIGVYSYSYAIATYFTLFIMLGLNNYGNRTIAMVREDPNMLSQTFWSIYFMQLLSGAIVICAYIIYALFYSNNIITWILLIYLISAAMDINWLFFGLEQFKITVTRNTIIKLITSASIFLFVKDRSDVYKYTLISVFGTLISQFVLWMYVPKFIYKKNVYRINVLEHIKPNLILFIPVMAISLYKYMDKIMLGILSSMQEVGYYEYSERVVQVPMALINSLGTVMLPRMSNLSIKGKSEIIQKYIFYSIIGVMSVSSIVCFGIMGVSDLFIPLFLGKEYDSCILLFKILLSSCFFLAFANVIRTQFLIPQTKEKIYIISIFTGAIVNLVLNLLLISKLGAYGVAFATFVAEAAVCISQAFMIRKELDIKRMIKNSLPFMTSGLLMYIGLVSINLNMKPLFGLFIKIIIGGIIYVGAFFITYIVIRDKDFGRDLKIIMKNFREKANSCSASKMSSTRK